MVWMLSAICGALLRQRFITALPNYDPYPGPSKAARMPRRKGATGRICLCNQAQLCQHFIPMAARTRTIQLSQLSQLNLVCFPLLTKHVICTTLRQLLVRVASPVPSCVYAFSNCTLCTVLDTENLHFSEEFLDFPVRTDADIHAEVLGFSARFRCGFPQDSARKNLGRNSARIRAENGETQQVRTYVVATHFLHKRRQMT